MQPDVRIRTTISAWVWRFDGWAESLLFMSPTECGLKAAVSLNARGLGDLEWSGHMQTFRLPPSLSKAWKVSYLGDVNTSLIVSVILLWGTKLIQVFQPKPSSHFFIFPSTGRYWDDDCYTEAWQRVESCLLRLRRGWRYSSTYILTSEGGGGVCISGRKPMCRYMRGPEQVTCCECIVPAASRLSYALCKPHVNYSLHELPVPGLPWGECIWATLPSFFKVHFSRI